MRRADLVTLGRVARSDGRDGTVKLRTPGRKPPRFSGQRVFVRRAGRLEPFVVESLALDRNAYRLKLEGIDSLAQADALTGLEILAEEDAFGPPEEGRYYDFQLIGSRVVTRAGEEVGRVTGYTEAVGASWLIVRRGEEDVLIPFTEAVCVRVDPAAKEIEIDPPEGLLDLNAI